MPIYEYQCQKCDSVFEVMQSISAKPLKTCQRDGCKGKVARLVSASGFILKGSGWYATDYPSDSRKQGWESEKQSASGPSAAPAESAPAAAAPPAEKPAPAKARKAPAAKNPYSGKGGKKVKTTKK